MNRFEKFISGISFIIGIVALIVLIWWGIWTSATSAFGAPPQGTDLTSPLHKWFEGLRNREGQSCCSEADGRPVEYRTNLRGQYEVFIDPDVYGFPPGSPYWKEPAWIEVKPERILVDTDNPLGQAYAWWTPYLGVLCFLRVSET